MNVIQNPDTVIIANAELLEILHDAIRSKTGRTPDQIVQADITAHYALDMKLCERVQLTVSLTPRNRP